MSCAAGALGSVGGLGCRRHCQLARALTAALAWVGVQMLQFIAHVVAALPYKRADEPLQLLAAINEAISRRAEDVSAGLQRLQQVPAPPQLHHPRAAAPRVLYAGGAWFVVLVFAGMDVW
jgi:hypothetical protein